MADVSTDNKQKKRKKYVGIVGGLNKITANTYKVFKTSLLGEAISSYSKVENAVIGSDELGGNKQNHRIKRSISGALEKSRGFDFLNRVVMAPLLCPLSTYGMMFLFYGLVCFATFIIPMLFGLEMLTRSQFAYIGGICMISSIPLLCSGNSLAVGVLQSAFFRGGETSERSIEILLKNKYSVGKRWALGFIGALIGAGCGVAAMFIGIATIPLAVLGIITVCTAVRYPEAGVVIAFTAIPFLIVFDFSGNILPILIAAIWVGYIIKLILGKRIFKVGLIGISVILLCVCIFTSGFFSAGGVDAVIKAIRYTLVISMFFPITSLMKNRGWTDRCLNGMMITSAISLVAIISVHLFGNTIVEWAASENFNLAIDFVKTVSNAETSPEKLSCFIILAFPSVTLPLIRSNRRRITSIISFICSILFVVEAILIPDIRCKTVMVLGIILFLVLYDHRVMSVVILSAVPAVGAYSFFLGGSGNGNAFLKSAGSAFGRLFTHPDSRITDGVYKMIADNLFGIGFGEKAFSAVYVGYAYPGFESVTYVDNFFAQLISSAGIAAGIVMLAVLILFILMSFEFIRFNTDVYVETGVLALWTGILSILVYGVCMWIWQNEIICFMFWAIMAICTSYIRNSRDDAERALGNGGCTPFSSDISMM